MPRGQPKPQTWSARLRLLGQCVAGGGDCLRLVRERKVGHGRRRRRRRRSSAGEGGSRPRLPARPVRDPVGPPAAGPGHAFVLAGGAGAREGGTGGLPRTVGPPQHRPKLKLLRGALLRGRGQPRWLVTSSASPGAHCVLQTRPTGAGCRIGSDRQVKEPCGGIAGGRGIRFYRRRSHPWKAVPAPIHRQRCSVPGGVLTGGQYLSSWGLHSRGEVGSR